MSEGTDGDVLVVLCKCGGWVMVATLAYANRETWSDAGELAEEGFEVRSPVPRHEYMGIDPCEHRGACTTDGSVQEEAALS